MLRSTARSISAASLVVVVAACSAGGSKTAEGPGDGSFVDGGAHDDTSSVFDVAKLDVAGETGDGGGPTCVAGALDMKGCACSTPGATRACFSGDASNRNVGTCKDGTQTCSTSGEVHTWSACSGDVLPQKEVCTDTVDHDCNGLTGCKDPSCATDPTCNTACKDGDTRDCYTGPAGTLGVGTCKAGKQTCTGGAWSATCDGEVLPGAEVCSDPLDHNCNHLPGCLDLFVCITDPACQGKCKDPLDTGCVCPEGTGDTATCPKGTFAKSGGDLSAPTLECCPCTSGDCGNPNCCNETVCAGSSWCGSVTCRDLPPSCGGKVSADCDDFPEDCDEPCCECYGDCSSPGP